MSPTKSLKKMSSGVGRGSSQGYLEAFLEHLKREGLSASRIRQLRISARHFLAWLIREGIEMDKIDDTVLCRFRRHDCHCPGMVGERRKMRATALRGFMTGALRLVRFLEDDGRIPHPGELDKGLSLLDDFIARCATDGYARDTLTSYRSACRHILVWLHRSRIPITAVDSGVLSRFLEHDCVCPGPFERPRKRIAGSRYVYPFEAFLRFLADRGVLPDPITPHGPEPGEQGFRDWLRRHRGLGDKTIHRYVRTVRSFVEELGPDPGRYDPERIRNVLLVRFQGTSWAQAKLLTTSMRMYLRFLASSGACPSRFVDAVPSAPAWRLDRLPRFLPAEAIDRVIACCDVTKPVGVRNRAILLLLARLALRAGDIVQLRLADIDWRNALIKVCGKSRRQIALPLPQEVGDAILAYLEHARPRVPQEAVFLRARAPYRPFASSNAVTDLVIYALKRAGLNQVRPQGAYLFRHSAATHLVRSGVPLEAIGALLRHRSTDTTTIYAKVNRPMLLEVAQPWIGDRP